MSLVEFTPRAEKSVLDLLARKHQAEEETLLVVEMRQGHVDLSLKGREDLMQLQRDLDMVGPFRVPLGDHEVPLFVRDEGAHTCGLYEVDCEATNGSNYFKARMRALEQQG